MNKKYIVIPLFCALVCMSQWAQGQIIKTKLEVTVRNELGNTVLGATVSLYADQNDYDSNENEVVSAKTDRKGKILFKDLESDAYFIHVFKGNKNNIGRGAKVENLIPKRKNKVNVIIE